MTEESFLNAMTIVSALGGSTNAVLPNAIAKSVNKISLNDFQEVSDRVPFLADLKPSGTYLMEDLHSIGGTPAILKYLLENKLINGDTITVTGNSLGDNLEKAPGLPNDQKVIFPLSSPIKKTGHIQILYGNLAPLGSVAKITGKEGLMSKATPEF